MKEPKFSCELCGKTYDLDTLIPFDDRLLQRSKNLPKTHIGTDSYIAVQLLEKQKCPELQQPPKGGRTSSGHFCVYGLRCAGQYLIEQESLLLDKTAFVAY